MQRATYCLVHALAPAEGFAPRKIYIADEEFCDIPADVEKGLTTVGTKGDNESTWFKQCKIEFSFLF